MSEWIEWHGGECPVNECQDVYVRIRNGGETENPIIAGAFIWTHRDRHYGDIVAYRVLND